MAKHKKSKGMEPDKKALALRSLKQLGSSISKVRDLINQARRHDSLIQRPNDFRLLCSAMDIVEDTIMGLESYTEHDQQDQGQAYLEIFGVLQALTVQQDGRMIRVAAESLPRWTWST